MIYECDNCEAMLGPGLTVCPRCGEAFDEPVPADALWNQPPFDALPEPDTLPDEVLGPPLLAEAAPLEAAPLSGSKPSSRHLPPSAVSLVLLGLCWLGFYYWGPPSTPVPVLAPAARPLTDLAAHPQYAANMTVLVQKLRATGVGAEWPAFGDNDVLLITPQARAAEPPMTWDADMNRRLAQGVYGSFALTRHESGFADGDTTACFVVVTGASGQVVAVDFMGRLE